MAESQTTEVPLTEKLLDDHEVKANLFYAPSDSDIEEFLKKKQKALKNMRKLLDVSEKYSKCCNDKFSKLFEKSEQERVDTMMKQKKAESKDGLIDLPYFKGQLRDYQFVGVKWMKTLFEYGVNGILADEMGLGKTVQIIAFICHLMKEIKGPFLIVVPLSTFPNWSNEFQRFAPDIPVVLFHGNAEQRRNLLHQLVKVYRVGEHTFRPVVITTNQMILKEMSIFTKITWKYLIIDEGHCLKNHEAQVSQSMRKLKCLNKLILTGTPLQNNLKELWSILNFLMPNIFNNVDTFSSLLLLGDFDDNSKIMKEEETHSVISSLHKILQPFMLRRIKADVLHDIVPKKEIIVYCPLTTVQRTLYKYTIKRNIAALSGIETDKKQEIPVEGRPKRRCTGGRVRKYQDEGSDDEFAYYEDVQKETEKILDEKITKGTLQYVKHITLQSPMTMYRQIVNHPYLVHMPVTPERTLLVDENLISESGKMMVLDRLLAKLKSRQHKVLIFSTSVMMLDLIEDFMIYRNHTYCRLDGQTSLARRAERMLEFNTNKDVFAFLISTRAGGLGLNLVGADTVILYDKDWNPQADIQAQDRCHRIGQTKPVVVYSLITKNTIDDRVLYCSSIKMKLDKVVIKGGKYDDPTPKKLTDKNIDANCLLSILEQDDSPIIVNQSDIFSDDEWEKLLDRSDLYAQMQAKL